MSYRTNEIPGFDWGLYRSIARKGSGKLSHNTYVTEHADGSIGVTLHATEIVRVSPDGWVTLDTGGWETVTTKQRMNAILSSWRGRIHQDNHIWYANGERYGNLTSRLHTVQVDELVDLDHESMQPSEDVLDLPRGVAS